LDPDECWKRTVELAEDILSKTEEELSSVDATDLAEYVTALNNWVSNGGYPPRVFTSRR
jgi:hypothetical protein